MATRAKGIAACLAGFFTWAQADTLPVSVFAARPAIENVLISPDGRYLLYQTTRNERWTVVTWDLQNTAEPTPVLSAGELDELSWCRWVGNSRFVCAVRRQSAGYRSLHPGFSTELVASNADGTHAGLLLTFGSAKDGFEEQLVSSHSADSRSILLESRAPTYTKVRSEVARLDVTSGKYEVVARPSRRMPLALDYIGDPSGRVLIASGFAGKRLGYWARVGGDAKWRQLFAYDPLQHPPRPVPFAIIPESHRAYGIGPGNKNAALFEMDLTQATADRLIYEAPDAPVLAPAMAANGTVLGVKLDTELPRVHYLHRRESSVIEGINKLFPHTFNEIVDLSSNKKLYVIRSTSDVDAGSYYLLDANKPNADLQLIGKVRADLDPAQLPRMRAITITLESGQSRRAFLSRPISPTLGKLPLVVMPDDGPTGRSEWRFSFLRHFLVSRGYAVLQLQLDETASASNYSAVRSDLDGLAYAFVRKAARWAIDQGVADANRVAIMGWGFGGYLAILGSRRDTGLFRCAIGVNAVTDLREQPGNHSVEKLIGNVPSSFSRSERAYYEQRSPILLVHGSHDTVVHPHHSVRMSLALSDSGMRDQRIEISEGSHDLSDPRARTQMLEAVEVFLAKHLAPAE